MDIRTSASTAYRSCGTCRMGSDHTAIVDSELRVRVMDSLRIIDASVIPTIPSTNIHAASIMIAEKGSDLLIGKTV